MEAFDLRSADVAVHRPEVLFTSDEGRAVLIALPAGEALQDHEVHERAWLSVVDGEVEVEAANAVRTAGPGTLVTFAPKERHEVRAVADARLLLLLSPWPGDGRTVGVDA